MKPLGDDVFTSYGDERMELVNHIDIIGDVEMAPAGNTVLRIGRQDKLGGTWEQVAHVVLTPADRAELITRLSKQEDEMRDKHRTTFHAALERTESGS